MGGGGLPHPGPDGGYPGQVLTGVRWPGQNGVLPVWTWDEVPPGRDGVPPAGMGYPLVGIRYPPVRTTEGVLAT